MKSFENLWEEAEEEVLENFPDQSIVNSEINHLILMLLNNEDYKNRYPEYIGKLIYFISWYSKTYDINVYTALRETIDHYKLKRLDPEILDE
jgi:hypothetical protein